MHTNGELAIEAVGQTQNCPTQGLQGFCSSNRQKSILGSRHYLKCRLDKKEITFSVEIKCPASYAERLGVSVYSPGRRDPDTTLPGRGAVVHGDTNLLRKAADEDGPDCPDAELYSEASSVITASKYSQSNSRISSRSSKNRRKAERKKLSLKEGSPMEDKALMHVIGEIITTVDKMREEIHGLLRALVLFQFDKQAEKLQRVYDEALQMMEGSVPEVWPEGLQNTSAPVTGPNSTANSIMALFQQQQKPAASQQDAEVPAAPKMRNGIKWKLTILK